MVVKWDLKNSLRSVLPLGLLICVKRAFRPVLFFLMGKSDKITRILSFLQQKYYSTSYYTAAAGIVLLPCNERKNNPV